MDITATSINSYAPALWSAKDARLTWKTTLIVGVAAAALCLLGVALRRLYHAYWAVKDVSKVDWSTRIFSNDTFSNESLFKLLHESGITECPYNKVLICYSSNGLAQEFFKTDGEFIFWNNDENHEGSKILFIMFPQDKQRSEAINNPNSCWLNRIQASMPYKSNVPKDMHIKFLTYSDWHGWFGKRSLSSRAIECMTTDMHNLNIQRI